MLKKSIKAKKLSIIIKKEAIFHFQSQKNTLLEDAEIYEFNRAAAQILFSKEGLIIFSYFT